MKIQYRVLLQCVILLLCLIVLVSCSTVAKAQLDTVTVEHVEDGDTFKTEQGEWIRLAGIDCPETDTKEGRTVKNYVERWIETRKVMIDRIEEGYYGRTIAYVYLMNDGGILNSKLLESRMAKIYNK